MDRKDLIDKEKEQFYSGIIEKANSKKIIIYGASVTAREVIKEVKKRRGEIWACCVSKKEVNRKEVDGVPVLQVNEIPSQMYADALFVIAVKPLNQKEIHKILSEKGIIDYVDVPKNLCMSSVSNQRIFIPGMEITTRIGCSVNCRYCPQDVLCRVYSARHNENSLSLHNFKTCLDKMPKDVVITFFRIRRAVFKSGMY